MTLIIYIKKNLNIFNKKKINIKILKYRLFKSLIARLLFVQSDVFCALCICSGVAKGYRCEDQALERNRKVCGWGGGGGGGGGGGSFGVDRRGESLQK